MLKVINKKMNSVLSYLAMGNPVDRAKIEELGFADKEETDKILVALDENKVVLDKQLKDLIEEEAKTREELMSAVLKGSFEKAVCFKLMEKTFIKEGDTVSAKAFSDMQDPVALSHIQEELEEDEILAGLDMEFNTQNAALPEKDVFSEDELIEAKQEVINLFDMANA